MMILLVLGVLQTALIRPYYRNDRLKTIEVLADTIIDELLEKYFADEELTIARDTAEIVSKLHK